MSENYVPDFLNNEIENHITPNEAINDYQELACMYAIYENKDTIIKYAIKKYNIKENEAKNILNSKSFLNLYNNIKKDIKDNPNLPIQLASRSAMLAILPFLIEKTKMQDTSAGDAAKVFRIFAELAGAISKNTENIGNAVQVVLNVGEKQPSWIK